MCILNPTQLGNWQSPNRQPRAGLRASRVMTLAGHGTPHPPAHSTTGNASTVSLAICGCVCTSHQRHSDTASPLTNPNRAFKRSDLDFMVVRMGAHGILWRTNQSLVPAAQDVHTHSTPGRPHPPTQRYGFSFPCRGRLDR